MPQSRETNSGAPITVVAVRGSGEIKLKARRDGTDCELEFPITIGCGSSPCSSGSCAEGQASLQNDSVNVRFDLGTRPNGESVGALQILRRKPEPVGGLSLGSVEALKFDYADADDSDVEATFDDDGAIASILTPTTYACVVPVSIDAYYIDFFPTTLVGTEYIADLSQGAIASWYVEQRGTVNDVHITKYGTGGFFVGELVAKYEYEYAGVEGDGGWTLSTYEYDAAGDPQLVQTEEVWTYFNASTSPTRFERTREIRDAGGNLVEEVLTYHPASAATDPLGPWTYRGVSTGGTAVLVTERGYHSSAYTACPECLQWEDGPDGSWEWHEYGYVGDRIRHTEYSGWLDQALPDLQNPGPELQTARKTVREYSTDGPAGGRTLVEEHIGNACVRKTTRELMNGIYWNSHEYFSDSGYLLTDEEICGAGAAKWSVYPDGRAVEYTCSDGDNWQRAVFSFIPESLWINYAPDDHEEGQHWAMEAVHRGENYALVEGQSTKEVTVKDHAGHVVFQGTYLYVDGQWSDQPVEWIVHERDFGGRIVASYYPNGSMESIEYEDCCGARIITKADGQVVREVHDLLGRLVERTQYGVSGGPVGLSADLVTTYSYDTGTDPGTGNAVRIVTRTLSSSAGGVDPKQWETWYDLAGRVVTEFQPSGLSTSYQYATTAGGGRQVTVTREDGETEIRDYYADGRIHSVYGSGVVEQTYEYGYDSYETSTTVYTGPAGVSSERWTKTTYDGIGRVVSEERPAFGLPSDPPIVTLYGYDNESTQPTGRLMKISTVQGETELAAPTLIEYPLSNCALMTHKAIRRGADVNGDGDLDVGGSGEDDDPITETHTEYELDSDDYWRVTRVWEYADGQPKPSGCEDPSFDPDRVTRTRLSGYSTSNTIVAESETQDEWGVITRTRTRLIAPGQLIEEVDYEFDGGFEVDTQRTIVAGLQATVTTRSGETVSYGYDGLHRVTSVTTSRTGRPTFTEYGDFGTSAVYTTGDNSPGGTRDTGTTYGYDPATGQLIAVGQLGSGGTYEYTRYAYTPRGEVSHVWGDIPQPIAYGYNTLGERTSMTTYRDGTNWSATDWASASSGATLADATTWTFDSATGLLTEKEYADATHVDYSYYADGRLWTRTWARGIVTAYDYDATNALALVDYDCTDPNNPASDIAYDFDRRGRIKSVTDNLGGTNHAFDYAVGKPLHVTETVSGGALDAAYEITRSTPAPADGKLTAITIETGDPLTTIYEAGYDYDAATGRLTRVFGPGLPPYTALPEMHGVHYAYYTGSNVVHEVTLRNGSGTDLLETTRELETGRDLIDFVQHEWSPSATEIAKYDYANDALGRRSGVEYTGVAFGSPDPAITQSFGYNDRNELTDSGRDNDGDETDDLTWGYAYDPIGNRITADRDADTWEYAINSLNQYTQTDLTTAATPNVASFEFDEDGNLTNSWAAADMNCDGAISASDIDPFVIAVVQGQTAYEAQFPNCEYMNADVNGDGIVSMADYDPFVAMITGSGNSALAMTYTWDAENRLIAAAPTFAQSGDARVSFAYDYLGRRVLKVVEQYDGSTWTETARRKFIWSGWLMLMELDCGTGVPPVNDAVVRKYTWGLDLAGLNGQINSLESAGGIGGLLGIYDADATPGPAGGDGNYAVLHDANGNVTQLIAWASTVEDDSETALGNAWDANRIAAHYEYGPYGNVLNDLTADDDLDGVPDAGAYAAANPWRFSTKQWDCETGLLYFGLRYRDRERWISRDPIEEAGGAHLYGFVLNAPVNYFDPIGQKIAGECESYQFRFDWNPAGSMKWAAPLLRQVPLLNHRFRIVYEHKNCKVCCAGKGRGHCANVWSKNVGVELDFRRKPAIAGWTAEVSANGSVNWGFNGCENKHFGGGCIQVRVCAGAMAHAGGYVEAITEGCVVGKCCATGQADGSFGVKCQVCASFRGMFRVNVGPVQSRYTKEDMVCWDWSWDDPSLLPR
jgi:RHS repeat-associated protein